MTYLKFCKAMKKILFNDKYGLTQAVLDGRKTQTRRILGYENYTQRYIEKIAVSDAKYKLGEVVAVGQSYKDAGVHFLPEEDDEFGCHNFPAEQTNGWTNKLFVRADLMSHRIRITNVRVERLQDISDEDCLAEGIIHAWTTNDGTKIYHTPHTKRGYLSTNVAQEAYAALINKISGKGTWDSNPFVFVYDFELVKD